MFSSRLSKTLYYNNKRMFSATSKLAKAELTIRTPYRALFESFSSYSRMYVWTVDGLMAIGNRSNPRVYLLPPGEIEIKGIERGVGNNTDSSDGKFMHTGGWLFVHENNSIDISLIECQERDNFDFEQLKTPVGMESDSAAGKIAAQLQEKTVKNLLRRR